MQSENSLVRQNDAEKELIIKLINDDKAAFTEIFQLYYKRVYFIAIRYLKDKPLAEDAIQEIFSKIWLNRKALNPDLSFKAFLYKMSTNHLLNVLRNSASAQRKILEFSALSAKEETIDSVNVSIEQSENLSKAIEQLPKKRRIIVKLRLFKGLSNDEVAKKLKISINTVKWQYTLAIKDLRRHLNV
jgi:RNA polymerase sigma-70 factor (family 1)